jgi:hypothetical protein
MSDPKDFPAYPDPNAVPLDAETMILHDENDPLARHMQHATRCLQRPLAHMAGHLAEDHAIPVEMIPHLLTAALGQFVGMLLGDAEARRHGYAGSGSDMDLIPAESRKQYGDAEARERFYRTLGTTLDLNLKQAVATIFDACRMREGENVTRLTPDQHASAKRAADDMLASLMRAKPEGNA